MYVRNASGQLMWIPPQGFTTQQVFHQNLRHQIQRDEWEQFNAPPPQDNLYFHDNYSHYEGSVSNGFRNVTQNQIPSTIFNRANMMRQGQHSYNRIDPPIPRVIHSTQQMPQVIHSPQMTTGPHHNTKAQDTALSQETSEICIPPPPSQNNVKVVEEEFIPETNVSCMSTIFGSSIDLYRYNYRSSKAGLLDCNPLNISTSDEAESDADSPSDLSRPQNQESVIKCNGIRGPGKKFDYSSDKNSISVNEQKECISTELEINATEQCVANSKEDLEMVITNSDKLSVNHEVLPKPSCEQSDHTVLASEYTRNIESHSTGDAVIEQNSIEERNCTVDSAPVTGEKNQNIKEQKIIVDPEEPAIGKKSTQKCDDSYRTLSDADYPQDEIAPQENNIHVTKILSNPEDETKYLEIKSKVCNETIIEAANSYISENYPSFDEPAAPQMGKESINMCHLTISPSGGENRQGNANITPPSQKIPISKIPLTSGRDLDEQSPFKEVQ